MSTLDALRRLFLASTLAGLAAPVTACPAAGAKRFEFRENHMGTEFKIVVYTDGEASARRASRAAFDRVAFLDNTLSDYNLDSELMRLCDRAGGPPVPVSEDLYRVLELAQSAWRRSGGAFDPTVKPVVKLWRRARRRAELPDPRDLDQARALVGAENLILDPATHSVRLAKPGMQLDLGGIAKGYAADAALATLREHGIGSALVAAAGDIVVGDPPPGAKGWRVGIASIDDPEGPAERVLELAHAAVSTSGDSAQYVVIDGNRYSHIVDPRTGLGANERASVTVVAPCGAIADSTATTLYLLGPDGGLRFAASMQGVEALIVRINDEGAREVFATPGWDRLPLAAPDPATDLTDGAQQLTP